MNHDQPDEKQKYYECCMEMGAELTDDHIIRLDDGRWFMQCMNPITYCPFCGIELPIKKQEENKETIYPEGGIDGMIMRDSGVKEGEYPLPEPSGIIITDQIDTARVELKKFREPPGVTIKTVHQVADVVRGMEDHDRERIKILHLDTKNRVIAVENISTGSVDASLIHPREAVKGAVLSNATSIVVVHNHPSGSTEPSQEDITVAQALVNAFRLMRIHVLDFVIVGKERFYSFRDADELPKPQVPVSELSGVAEGGSEACQLAYRAALEVLEEQCGEQ